MQQLTKLYKKLAYRLSYADAMNVLLDAILFPVCIQAHADYQLTNPVSRFNLNDSEIATLKQLLVCTGDLAEAGQDPFGNLFMEYISKGHNGQYFSSMDICTFMTQLTMLGRENKPQQRISDPACGSGRMFLAAAALRGKTNHFFGTDTDDMCCRMATANMILHNLVADISCGNELSMRFSHVYIVRRDPFFNFPTLRILKYVKGEPSPSKDQRQPAHEASLPEPKSEKERYVQGTLF